MNMLYVAVIIFPRRLLWPQYYYLSSSSILLCGQSHWHFQMARASSCIKQHIHPSLLSSTKLISVYILSKYLGWKDRNTSKRITAWHWDHVPTIRNPHPSLHSTIKIKLGWCQCFLTEINVIWLLLGHQKYERSAFPH